MLPVIVRAPGEAVCLAETFSKNGGQEPACPGGEPGQYMFLGFRCSWAKPVQVGGGGRGGGGGGGGGGESRDEGRGGDVGGVGDGEDEERGEEEEGSESVEKCMMNMCKWRMAGVAG